MTLALSTVPLAAKAARSESLVAEYGKLPT
jgi:hypothetical protein